MLALSLLLSIGVVHAQETTQSSIHYQISTDTQNVSANGLINEPLPISIKSLNAQDYSSSKCVFKGPQNQEITQEFKMEAKSNLDITLTAVEVNSSSVKTIVSIVTNQPSENKAPERIQVNPDCTVLVGSYSENYITIVKDLLLNETNEIVLPNDKIVKIQVSVE